MKERTMILRAPVARFGRAVCILGISMLFLVDCGFAKKLNKAAGRLVDTLQKDDYAAFSATATPKLRKALPEKRFHLLSKEVRRLGKVNKLKQGSVRSDCGEKNLDGHFVVHFAEAKVTLKIWIANKDKLDKFEFEGEGLENLGPE